MKLRSLKRFRGEALCWYIKKMGGENGRKHKWETGGTVGRVPDASLKRGGCYLGTSTGKETTHGLSRAEGEREGWREKREEGSIPNGCVNSRGRKPVCEGDRRYRKRKCVHDGSGLKTEATWRE